MIDHPPLRLGDLRIPTGVRLHYAEPGDPGGEPVVFVHGWPDSWFSFSRVLPLLPAWVRTVAIDQVATDIASHIRRTEARSTKRGRSRS